MSLCLLPALPPDNLDAETAELRAVQLFGFDFYRRYPFGYVLTQYSYMARTTAAPLLPGPLILESNPMMTEVNRALSSDFRRWIKERDYRKCDAMGIAPDSYHGELLEVTTEKNRASADWQLFTKLDTLRYTVNRIHGLPIDWGRSNWKPNLLETFYPIPPRPANASQGRPAREARFVCYRPSQMPGVPHGVVLYEIHELRRLQPQEVVIPSETADQLRRRYREFRRVLLINPAGIAADFARTNPQAMRALEQTLQDIGRTGAGLGAAVMLVLAIAAAFDPAPGDECVAATFAESLARIAAGPARAF